MGMTIGSGSAGKFLSGTKTKGFKDLIIDFVSDEPKDWNSFASPIDALRTGAILELRYGDVMSDDYYFQYKQESEEMDCLVSTIDFAKIEKGKVVDFEELKSIFFTEFIEYIKPLTKLSPEEQVKFISKKFKSNYNQVQFQLFCTGLDEGGLTFLSVETYDDDTNYLRQIKDEDYVKFRIPRDEKVISLIRERAAFFQSIKNYTT